MRDNRLQALAKGMARWRYETDLHFTRWLAAKTGGEPQVRLVGSCNSCGECCRTPMVQVHTVFFFARSLRWIILTWHRYVNGFEYIGENRRERCFIFRCTHFDPQSKRCDSYATRPGMCRDYPVNLLDHPNPKLPPQCSYQLVAVNAAEIRASLAELELDQQTRQELEQRFHAGECNSDKSDNQPRP